MFPGATETAASGACYTVVGAPLERSVTFHPGTQFGPREIRHHAGGFENYDHRTDQAFTELGVTDAGDVRPWHDAAAYSEFLTGELQDIVADNAIPVLLGGEHTVTVAGVTATNPSVYVCIDAHLDLRETFDGDPWSHATVHNHVAERVDELIILGARAGAASEWERAETSSSITVVPPEAIDAWLTDSMMSMIDQRDTYLSIDIDGIDPTYAPATGTREPFGLTPTHVRSVIDGIAPQTVGFDIVEVSDRDDGQTATLAAKMLREFVFQHASQQ